MSREDEIVHVWTNRSYATSGFTDDAKAMRGTAGLLEETFN